MASTTEQSYPHGLSHQQHYEPQRLSGIYQYHNAPEVLPEHGLEYDDTTYPTSDKYPVTHSMDDHNSTFHNMQAAAAAAITRGGSVSTQQYLNKPPRIIFGMKLRSFLLVALVFVLIVVGAVVGGTVGRNSAKLTGTTAAGEQQQSGLSSSATSSSSTLASSISGVRTITPTTMITLTTSSTTTFSTAAAVAASTPTFSPLTSCPSTNNTSFTPSTITNQNTTTTTRTFTRYCNVSAPSTLTTLTSAFVYTFDDCIELCAGFAVVVVDGEEAAAAAAAKCNIAVYNVFGSRPFNCLVGFATTTAGAAADAGAAGGNVQTIAFSDLGVGGLAVGLLSV